MAAGKKEKISAATVMSRVDNLPTLPIVALRVGELVNDPDSSAKDIAAVMQGDPSLSAKVLRLVNSPYYAIPGGVSDVHRAISFVGFNTLHQLVLSVSVLQALKTSKGSRFNARGLWLHSLGVGACAEVISRHLGHRDPGACFTAGLLHDIGKIALAIAAPDEFCQALEDASRNGKLMSIAERDAGLPSHDRIGSYLAKKWKFPAELMMPIQHHHGGHRSSVRRELAPSLVSMVDIVSVADEVCRVYRIGDSGSPPPERKDNSNLERLGVTKHQAGKIYSDLMRKLETSRVFLTMVDADDDEEAAGGVSNCSHSTISSTGGAASAADGMETTNRAPLPGARS